MRCQWRTVADTAKSPEDFIDSTGAVEFVSGSRNSTINIKIVDNNISELEKTFRVDLFNAENGGMLSLTQFITLGCHLVRYTCTVYQVWSGLETILVRSVCFTVKP